MSIESRFTVAEFRELCFSIVEHAAWSLAAREPGRQPAVEFAGTLSDRRNRVLQSIELAGIDFLPALHRTEKLLSGLINLPAGETPRELLDKRVLDEACHLAAILESNSMDAPPPGGDPLFHLSAEHRKFVLTFEGDLVRAGKESMTNEEWHGLSSPQRFLAAVMQMCNFHREQAVNKTFCLPPTDALALERGVQLLELGIQPPRIFSPIQTSIRRPYGTYLSFADPGPGHLEVTVRDLKLLQGTIVHIEYIDRGTIAEKSLTEAYRIPSIRHVARIRLMVGESSPCTVYIGRPTFESKRFENDIIKSAHTIAAACSAMFGMGIADCKVAMDGMTASEAVQFMKAVAGNTIRDRFTQRLSAAFNLNSDLEDDRIAGQNPVKLDRGLATAQVAIRLTRDGHFDKVTWDGAGDGESKPLVPDQLKVHELLELVHSAHENGLETYISAGMDANNMRLVTGVGVGGVGIGTKLHNRAPVTNAIGRVNPAAVLRVLQNRNEAANQPAGIAAVRLAQLDWLFYEIQTNHLLSGLRATISPLRTGLYDTLKSYWMKADEADRIPFHDSLKEWAEKADTFLKSIQPSPNVDDGPTTWRPYGRTLGGTRDTPTSTATEGIAVSKSTTAPVEPAHPVLVKAQQILAAFRALHRPAGDVATPTGAHDPTAAQIRELEQLIEQQDIPGIRSWLQQ